ALYGGLARCQQSTDQEDRKRHATLEVSSPPLERPAMGLAIRRRHGCAIFRDDRLPFRGQRGSGLRLRVRSRRAARLCDGPLRVGYGLAGWRGWSLDVLNCARRRGSSRFDWYAGAFGGVEHWLVGRTAARAIRIAIGCRAGERRNVRFASATLVI